MGVEDVERRALQRQRGMDGAQDAGVAREPQAGGPPVLGEQQANLAPQAVAADRVEAVQVALEQPAGVRLDLEAEPARVAHGPQDARGVVDEAAGAQRADEPGAEVGSAVVGIEQVSPIALAEAGRHRVDGKIAAGRVLPHRAGADVGEGAGAGVSLGPGPGEVQRETADDQLGGVEPGAGGHVAAQSGRQRVRQPVDCAVGDHVQVDGPAAKQHVAHRAADEVQPRAALIRYGGRAAEQADLVGR